VAREELYADLAGAILDGAPIDWAAAESSSDESDRPLLDRLKLIAALADLHRRGARPGAASAEAAQGAAGARCWGHLRVLERIGHGGFGEVYRAWDERLDREVALKLLPRRASDGESRRTKIIEEGRVLARVRHPNVVTLYGAEEIDGQVGLWMELVRGRTLEQAIADGRRSTAAEIVPLGIEICRAAAAVHAAGLLHRDIKAANVMVAEDGRVVLMDFGTGRELDDASAPLAGTPLYLAPELFRGGEPTAASDVYSIGVLLYRLLTGSYPVRARSRDELRRAHDRGERVDLATARPDLASELARAVDCAIDTDPRRRPATAEALAADLAALLPRAGGRRWPRRLAAAAAVALLLGAAWELVARRSGSFSAPSSLAGAAGRRLAGVAPSERRIVDPVIAVLPFDNLSGRADRDDFVDGLTDEILRDLARVDGLQVRSRYSAFTFKGSRDLRAVADRLGANLIVSGSVLSTDGGLRVHAQLVDPARDVPLWADRFDRKLESSGDILAVVDEIARGIVNELRLTLGQGRRRYDLDIETWELYLRARDLADRRGIDAPSRAVALFERILACDPAFAPAHAGLADAYFFLSIPTGAVTFDVAHGLMRQAAARALELDPLLAEAHAAMGVVLAREHAWERSERAFRRALELDPTLTGSYTRFSISTLRPLGRFDEAERLLETALEHDPLSLDVEREIGEIQFCTGRYDEAIATLDRVQAIDPDLTFVHLFLARALAFAGRFPEAFASFAEVERRERAAPHYLAHALVLAGRRAEAEALAVANHGKPIQATVIYAALGDLDRSFEALERLIALEPQRVPLLLTFPEMTALLDDPRMTAIRERFGLRQQREE